MVFKWFYIGFIWCRMWVFIWFWMWALTWLRMWAFRWLRTGALIWLRISQLYDYESGSHMTRNVAVIWLPISHLCDYDCRSYVTTNVAVDYECHSFMTTNVALVCLRMLQSYDCEIGAETTNVRPKFSSVPFFRYMLKFRMSGYRRIFECALFSIFMVFRNSSVSLKFSTVPLFPDNMEIPNVSEPPNFSNAPFFKII